MLSKAAAGTRKRNKRAVTGERPPSFVSKSTLAAELDMSESTVDTLVERGILPRPSKYAGSVRWHWADIVAALSANSVAETDPFMAGVANVS